MILKKGEYIGTTDQLFREIHVGDTIQDSKGKLYTVNGYGNAKPLDGGNELPVRSIHGCEVVIPWRDPEAPVPYSPVPEPHFDPAPPEPAPEVVPAIKAISSPRGGRANLSGVASFQNLARSMGITASKLKEIAIDKGFDVVRCQTRNRNAGIRTDDVERFRALLPKKPETKAGTTVSIVPSPEPVEYDKDGRHYVDFTGRMPASRPSLEDIPDQTLADELRRRGFEVVAVKRVEL